MLWLISLLITAAATGSGIFPKDLDHLNSDRLDENKIVDAVRDYDVLQKAMAKWDLDIAESLSSKASDEKKARTDQAKKRYDTIEKAYQALLVHYPNNARAQNYYGEFLYDIREDAAGALQAWKLANALDPKLSLPYNNLGIHYCWTGDYTLGMQNLKKAIELDPANADFKFNLAQIYLINWPDVQKITKWNTQKVFAEAMKLSKSAAELRPDDFSLQQDYAVNFFAADRFQAKVDWTIAAEAWQKARAQAQQNDQVFNSWLNEGRAWSEKPDNAHAETCFLEALKIFPDNQIAKDLLAKVRNPQTKPEPASPK